MEEAEIKKAANEIKLRDDYDLLQIMGHPPGWILYWGMVMILIVTAGLLVLSWMVKYPDVIPARITLTTENPPVRVVGRADGKIAELFVADGAVVEAGQEIITLDNNAEKKSIEQLEKFLKNISQQNIPLDKINPPTNLELGDLESDYANFVRQWSAYRFDLEGATVDKKATIIQRQIEQVQSLNEALRQQENTLREMLAVAEKKRMRQQDLLTDGSVSVESVEAAEEAYLIARGNLESLQNQLISNNIKIEELQLTVLDFKEGKKNTDYDQSLGVNEGLAGLKEAIKAWKRKFIITAPIAGKIATTRILATQQFVKENEIILTIVPASTEEKLIGRALLPRRGAGKITSGMPVNIRLDGFPYQEFGAVKATVAQVSLVPEVDGQYLVMVDMPKTMVTTYNKLIPFQQEMQGTANIITEERRIITRIFDKVLSLALEN